MKQAWTKIIRSFLCFELNLFNHHHLTHLKPKKLTLLSRLLLFTKLDWRKQVSVWQTRWRFKMLSFSNFRIHLFSCDFGKRDQNLENWNFEPTVGRLAGTWEKGKRCQEIKISLIHPLLLFFLLNVKMPNGKWQRRKTF